jgi:hypothetical protein
MLKNNILEGLVIRLKEMVKLGHYNAIDEIFKEQKLNKKEKRILCHSIINNIFFFSFQSFNTNPEFITKEQTNRELAVIKHFELTEQLELLVSLNEINNKHIDLLRCNSKNKKKLQNIDKDLISRITINSFNNENFSIIDNLETKLGYSILEDEINCFWIHYKEEYGYGAYYIMLEDKKVKPFYDIVLNYSLEKKTYLEKNGIILPTEKLCEEIKESLIKNLNNNPYYNKEDRNKKINNIEDGIRLYLINYNYYNYNNEIKCKKLDLSSNKKTKI